MLEITGQFSNVRLESRQWFLWQCGRIQCTNIECMPQFRRYTIEFLLAGLNIAMIVRCLAQIHLLRIIRQLAEVI